jgi:hypothetical protein
MVPRIVPWNPHPSMDEGPMRRITSDVLSLSLILQFARRCLGRRPLRFFHRWFFSFAAGSGEVQLVSVINLSYQS